MGTHARIGILEADGTVRSIYNQLDGFVDVLGWTLVQEYNTQEKVNDLINLGPCEYPGELRRGVYPRILINHNVEDYISGIHSEYLSYLFVFNTWYFHNRHENGWLWLDADTAIAVYEIENPQQEE